jgi:hypothetical protein
MGSDYRISGAEKFSEATGDGTEQIYCLVFVSLLWQVEFCSQLLQGTVPYLWKKRISDN